MRLSLLQLDPRVGDLDANVARILEATAEARRRGATLAVTAELAVTGYPPRDLLDRPGFLAAVERAHARLVEGVPPGVTLVVGTIEPRGQEGRPAYNSALVVRGGSVVARARKRLLPSYDVFDEDRWFEPGDASARIDVDGVCVALTICEDAWNDAPVAPGAFGPRPPRYHSDPVADALAQPTGLLVNLSASPFTLPKLRARPAMFAAIARRHAVPVAFVNQVGGQDELLFDGRSALFGPDGAVRARAAAFREEVLVCDLEAGGELAPDLASDEEAAYEALVMGTRDYARKCGFRDVVLGLSGGIDSALTAAIAADALGPEHVLGVALPTRYSSEGSRTDASDLAARLGIRFREVPIDGIFGAFLRDLEPALDDLSPARPGDVSLENVQARIRGAVLMAISNRTGALLLTTGNKSELGVGYCTLYGDMCGGLAVISDVPKTFVYRLARWVNRGAERIPRASIDKPPSAELRPDQLDQDSLPPYDVLDRVLELFVEEGWGRAQIVAAGIEPGVVDRVLSLVQSSEYKRRQAAPGLILTKKAFGMGRRMPIAQGFRE